MIKALLAVVLMTGSAFAAQVNPTSNVLGDTAGTAGTLVLRDTNGVVDAANLVQDGTILTAKLAANVVTTPKLLLTDQTQGAAACVTTKKSIGFCTGTVSASGTCPCS